MAAFALTGDDEDAPLAMPKMVLRAGDPQQEYSGLTRVAIVSTCPCTSSPPTASLESP